MQANHLRWIGLLTVTAFLAMAWTPTAAAIPDVPCEALPDATAYRYCYASERVAQRHQANACRTAYAATADVADDAADMAYKACRSL